MVCVSIAVSPPFMESVVACWFGYCGRRGYGHVRRRSGGESSHIEKQLGASDWTL
jgi:hypothetical protein